ncbi:MAG: hypothetical protein GXW99_12720 [Clostridiales bacterium]|nr:hypothetical protein [Clostridiales bacterium]
MPTNFKTSVFGGFDREDVIAFIEKTSSENQEKISALEKENEELKTANDSMEKELSDLRGMLTVAEEGGPARKELEEQVAGLTAKAENLEREAQELRMQTEEYQAIKNHIADIEINAHRRTEEFRRETIGQLQQLIAGERAWCAEAKQRYGAQNSAILEQLHSVQQQLQRQLAEAQEEIGTYSPDTFEQLEQQLATLAGQLKIES